MKVDYLCEHSFINFNGQFLRVLTAQGHASPAWPLCTQTCGHPCRFDPERFLPPRNEGTAGGLEGFMLAFGGEDSFNSHACGGKQVAIAFLLAFTARVCQVTAFVSDSIDFTKHLQALPADP